MLFLQKPYHYNLCIECNFEWMRDVGDQRSREWIVRGFWQVTLETCEENQIDKNTNEEVLTPGKRKKYIESDKEKTMGNYESRFYVKNYTT